MRFKIDWASLIVGSKLTAFTLFYFVFEGNFQVKAPGGLYLEGLIHGGAYFRNFTVFNLYGRLNFYFRLIFFFSFVLVLLIGEKEAEYSDQSKWVLVPGSWLLMTTLIIYCWMNMFKPVMYSFC